MAEINGEGKGGMSYFDHMIGSMQGKPDVIKSKETTVHVIPLFGIGSHTYVVTTYRRREDGDYTFLEIMGEAGSTRLVLPPKVSSVIARQRDTLNKKSRSKASRQSMEERMARGEKPGFMKGGK